MDRNFSSLFKNIGKTFYEVHPYNEYIAQVILIYKYYYSINIFIKPTPRQFSQ